MGSPQGKDTKEQSQMPSPQGKEKKEQSEKVTVNIRHGCSIAELTSAGRRVILNFGSANRGRMGHCCS